MDIGKLCMHKSSEDSEPWGQKSVQKVSVTKGQSMQGLDY